MCNVVCALKGRTELFFPHLGGADKFFTDLSQTFHVWLPSACASGAQTEFSNGFLVITDH
jgi:hypothetical protein